MTLRTKIAVFLLPLLIPLLAVIYLNYSQQSEYVKGSLSSICSLMARSGAQHLEDYINQNNTSFVSLYSSIKNNIIDINNVTPKQDTLIGAAMLQNPGFAMVVITDAEGQTAYSKTNLKGKNKHIHPHNITDKKAIPPQHLARLQESLRAWRAEHPQQVAESEQINEQLNLLYQRGQVNSEEYRQNQARVTELNESLSHPPYTTFFGGKRLSILAGLLFNSKTILFISPILDDSLSLKGFLLAVLDWTTIDDLVFSMEADIRTRGLPSAKILLYKTTEE
ncbi:hypothetical protein OAN24_05390, partial [Pseudodesulfovibrio sp.]|nr:hypothetical protein [Pseudodesulfovibrio sp.]